MTLQMTSDGGREGRRACVRCVRVVEGVVLFGGGGGGVASQEGSRKRCKSSTLGDRLMDTYRVCSAEAVFAPCLLRRPRAIVA